MNYNQLLQENSLKLEDLKIFIRERYDIEPITKPQYWLWDELIYETKTKTIYVCVDVYDTFSDYNKSLNHLDGKQFIGYQCNNKETDGGFSAPLDSIEELIEMMDKDIKPSQVQTRLF